MAPANRQWKGRTGGGAFGQKYLFWILSHVRVTCIYPVLYVVIPFYMFFGRKAYKAVYCYFRRRFGKNWWQAFWSTYRSHLCFGRVVLDKFAVLAGNTKQFNITIDNFEEFNRAMDKPEGIIVVSAHIGNFELAGICMPQDKKNMNGLVYGGETREMQRHRAESFKKSHLNLIPVSDDMSHLFAIKNALDRGEIVTIPCDRLLGSPKSYQCEFLGKDAKFPIGTFRLAAQMEVPVYCIFILKGNGLSYHGYVSKLQPLENEKASVKKAEHYGRQYVSLLESIVKKYPEQWFNYFDFWNELD
ncbi:MAG: lipid A biosynthesis (KDO)2-(lauroyl)-lipid IVA acyltransferase [Bacteroidales bacterium]|nr:lipid A biosynthesis (KDO)2-(lauroyl)-lipid IVA acyltransferase [Bacteroidales bacterium]